MALIIHRCSTCKKLVETRLNGFRDDPYKDFPGYCARTASHCERCRSLENHLCWLRDLQVHFQTHSVAEQDELAQALLEGCPLQLPDNGGA